MCGICGIIGLSDSAALHEMVHAMEHRGPDDSGVFSENGVSMGMTRLSILDTSEAGHQPMVTPDKKVVLVFNGEIYNYREERAILEKKGCSFRSTSDTEVVLRMYEYYGDDFLRRLRGMFALAVYDRGRERVLLARDQFGIKPLLYARRGKYLVFASEIKALLASGLIEKTINPVGLGSLLTRGSVSQPMTMIQGVTMLPPASKLIIKDGHEKLERFWKFQTDRYGDLKRLDNARMVERIKQELMECVRLQMVSDVPVGAFLSGGIDSSLLVAMMSRYTDHPVRTMSVGFDRSFKDIDETDDALRVASLLKTDHFRLEISAKDLRDNLQHIAASLDQPTVDGVNSYYVSLAASKVVTVALSGTGGDELFAGYPWFYNLHMHYGNRENKGLKKLFGRMVKKGDRSEFSRSFFEQYHILPMASVQGLLTAEIAAEIRLPESELAILEDSDELPRAGPLERTTALCLRGYTQNQLLRDIDAVSMAHSIEIRVPYLDMKLVDLALSLPSSAKWSNLAAGVNPYTASYRETGSKRILFQIGSEFLPPDMDRQKKRGFSLPLASWLKNELRDCVNDILSDQSLRKRGLFDADAIKDITSGFFEGKAGWPSVWLPFITELWCREVLDKTIQPRYAHDDRSLSGKA